MVFGRKGKLNYTSAAKKDIDKNFIIKNGKCRSVKELVNDKMLVPGDAVGYCGGHGHALIYAGKSKNGKYSFYEVDGPNGKVLTYNNIIKRTRPASFQIGDILHAK